MNKWYGTGRLTKDPEIRYTTGEKQMAVASFSIAVDRRGKQETDFFNCTAWGKTAEHMEKYWHKGMKAAISGRVENETWTGKDGQKRTTTKIVVEDIEFCERKQEQDQGQDKGKTEDWLRMDDVTEDLPFKL